MKICNACNKTQALDQFYYAKSNKDKLRLQCKICCSKKSVLYQLKKPEQTKNKLLIRDYGITLNQYNLMLEIQNNLCLICNKNEIIIDPRTNKIKSLCVDHNHITGKVRGLLCNNCNAGLGNFKDNILNLEKALEYLKNNI